MKAHKGLHPKTVTGLCDAFVFVIPFLVLNVTEADLLFHLSEYSICNSTETGLVSFLENPGGFIPWLGTYLTSLCHFPWLGALVLSLLCVLLRRLARALSQDQNGISADLLSMIPPFMMILFICRMDYSIYLMKDYGVLFSQILGLCAICVLLSLYRRSIDIGRYHTFATAILIALTYPLLGFYTLVTLLICIIISILYARDDLITGITCFALALTLPVLAYCLPGSYVRMNPHAHLLGGIPFRSFVEDNAAFTPLVVSIFSMACECIPRNRQIWTGTSLAAAVASVGALFFFMNHDESFRATLKIEKAVEQEEWGKVIEISGRIAQPTRAIVMYRNIALYNTGRLCEDMFSFPSSSTAPNSRVHVPISLVCSPDVLYWTGLLNPSERWAMERSVSFGKNIHNYKLLAKKSILGKDWEVARKYVDVIGKQPFQKHWAMKYSGMIDNPRAIESSPEFSRIIPLMPDEDSGTTSGNLAEMIILRYYSEAPSDNPNMYEWKMAALMTRKAESEFMQAFFDHYNQFPDEHIPKSIAQAAVLFGASSGNMAMYQKIGEIFRNDKELLKSFGAFGNVLNSTPDLASESSRSWFRKKYGNTYWFYYYFVNDIATD